MYHLLYSILNIFIDDLGTPFWGETTEVSVHLWIPTDISPGASERGIDQGASTNGGEVTGKERGVGVSYDKSFCLPIAHPIWH